GVDRTPLDVEKERGLGAGGGRVRGVAPGGRGLGNGSRGNQRALLVARGLARGDENVTGPIRPLSTLVGRWKAVRHRELSPIQLTRAEAENNPIMTTATTPFSGRQALTAGESGP